MTTEAPVAPEVGSKTTAENIVKGIADKAAGKLPGKPGDVKAAGKAGETAPVADPNAGKEKYLVDGKDVWLTPAQAHAYVQKGIAFEPKVSELARLQSETSQFFDLLKSDPGKVLYDQRIGLTPEVALEKILASGKITDQVKEIVGKWYYDNVIAPSKLDPVARELAETKKLLSDRELSDKAKADEALARDNVNRVNAAMAQIKGQIGEAMKEIGLPNFDTPIGAQLAKRVADVMRLSYLSRRPCTPKEAAVKVREEIRAYQRSYYDVLDEKGLVEELGKENAEKVRKYFLKIVKESEKEPPKNTGAPRTERKGERKVITPDDFHDYLEERKRNAK